MSSALESFGGNPGTTVTLLPRTPGLLLGPFHRLISKHHRATARTDMTMAVSFGGRERRLDEFTQLLADAGLVLAHARATAGEWLLLEARRG